MGPVPESVRKYHGQAGDEKQRHVYRFHGHDADEFLVKPVTKAELEAVDLKKAEPTAAERVEALRAAVNKAIAGISLDPVGDELVDYLTKDLGVTLPTAPPKAVAKAEEPPVSKSEKPDPVKRAAQELGKTLDVLAAAKAVLAQLKP